MDPLIVGTVVSAVVAIAGGGVAARAVLRRHDELVRSVSERSPSVTSAEHRSVTHPTGGGVGAPARDSLAPSTTPHMGTSKPPAKQSTTVRARSKKPMDSNVKVAIIGGVFTLAGVIATGSFGLASGLTDKNASVSCTDELTKAAALYKQNPAAWLPLKADDAVEQQCNVNAYIRRLGPITGP